MGGGYWVEIEPFDPAGPSLGHRRGMLKLHARQVEALESLIARAPHLDGEGLFRSLIYRLQCGIEREERQLQHDEREELTRLHALNGATS